MVLKRSIPNLNLELLGFFLDHFFQTEDRSFLVVERGSLGLGDCRDEQGRIFDGDRLVRKLDLVAWAAKVSALSSNLKPKTNIFDDFRNSMTIIVLNFCI